MTTLSITYAKTMTYDAAAAARSFAILDKLATFTGALVQAVRTAAGSVSTVPALRAARL